MRQGKATVNLGLLLIFRREKSDKLGVAVDLSRMGIAMRFGFGQEVVLHLVERLRDARYELSPWRKGLCLHILIAAKHADRSLGDVARTDLQAQRHTLFNMLPRLFAATQVAIIDLHLQLLTGIHLLA